MKAPNIDIPAGLEEAYYGIVRLLGGVNPDTIILKKGSPAKQNFSSVGSRSLFVRWQNLYNGLSGARHLAWTAYWGSLPFGSHGGLHGYPGSGFSAFVYVNAPRYQLGLQLLLDPPFLNLVFNGNFSLGGDGWNFFHGNFTSNRANFLPTSNDSELSQTSEKKFTFTELHTYRLSGFISSGAGHVFAKILPDSGSPPSGLDVEFAGGHGSFSIEGICGISSIAKVVFSTLDGFDGYVDSLVVQDLGVL